MTLETVRVVVALLFLGGGLAALALAAWKADVWLLGVALGCLFLSVVTWCVAAAR